MHRLAHRPCRPAILLLGSLIAPAIGCSKDSGGSTRQETAASSPADTGRRDTASGPTIPQPDTAATAPKKVSNGTPPAVKAPKPRPSTPSINPPPATPRPAAAPSPGSGASQEKWVTYDAAKNAVTVGLQAGPFTFNGYRNGEGSLIVPSNANVVINFVNKDGTPHSAAVIPGEGPIPNAGGDAAIPRAYTNKLLEGLPQEATDVMSFTVPASGTYRIFCGVPGHGLSGMWIWFKVDPAAKAPSFGPTKQ